jgi:uncharacterized protein
MEIGCTHDRRPYGKEMKLMIDPDRLEACKRTAYAREAARRREVAARSETAWRIARQAARMLKADFGATRVIVFGSLAHGAWFTARSDIDLAAEGIPPHAFFKSWCALDGLGSSFEINLVAIESASEEMIREIRELGIEL